jgi:hypothetical protein
MQTLISEGIARLAGASSQAIFHLKQAMGGGKTHLLVGFGLLARHPELRKAYCAGMPHASNFNSANIAAFNGRNSPPHFFWGEIASQLEKADLFQEYWASGPKAPDEKAWIQLFDGADPVLILLDEMPPYFEDLATRPGGAGTVADIATRAFANLLTAAGKKSKVCVVISDLWAAYQSGGALINRALDNARQELGRQERNITPVDLAANEIYDILRKRLFSSVPDKAEIEDIAAAFGRKLEEAAKSKTASRGAEAIADEIAATYPFHPQLKNIVAVEPEDILPDSAPVDWSIPEYAKVKVAWREDLTELERRRLEAQMLPRVPYRERVENAKRPEEVGELVHEHIWEAVNAHLGTSADAFPDLVEQLGVMRYGHRPRLADTFCGSGQIPFEAARLGCEVYASDLNPVACMLTWGAFHIVGGSPERREDLMREQQKLMRKVQADIDLLGVETDGQGWRAKVFLYCVEARCPQTGWMVPLLPTRVVSKGYRVIAELVPDPIGHRYEVAIRSGVTDKELAAAEKGTVISDGRGQDPYLIHTIDGSEYRTKISTLRGDYRKNDGTIGNRLRMWEKGDFKPKPDDIFQERVYCIQWMRPKKKGRGDEYEFRAVTDADLKRERIVEEFIAEHLAEWQEKGWAPDMRIEPGYNTDQPIRERGWTHWHHLFNPRQLLIAGMVNRFSDARLKFGLVQALNFITDPNPYGTSTRLFHRAISTIPDKYYRDSKLNLTAFVTFHHRPPWLR